MSLLCMCVCACTNHCRFVIFKNLFVHKSWQGLNYSCDFDNELYDQKLKIEFSVESSSPEVQE